MSYLTERRTDRHLSMGIGALWIAALLFQSILSLTPWPDNLFRMDFISFWTAASLMRDGSGPLLADLDTQRAFQVQLRLEEATTQEIRLAPGYNPYPNPPPLALPFLPLTLLPLPWAYLLWWLLSLSAFCVAVSMPLRGRPLGRTWTVVMLSFGGVTSTLIEGQPYGFFLLAFVSALLAMASGRSLLGGLLLGLLCLKPQYAVLFGLVFLVKRRWTELAGMSITAFGVGILSLVMVGPAGIMGYVGLLQRIGGFHSSLVHPTAMINWRAVLIHLWPSIPDSTGSFLTLVLGAATVLATLLAWQGEWLPSSPRFALQMLVLTMATIVASPHSHFHGTVLLLAPVALARNPVGSPLARVWHPLLVFGYLLALILWPLGEWRWLLVPYILVMIALLTLQCRLSPPFGYEPGHVPGMARQEVKGNTEAWRAD